MLYKLVRKLKMPGACQLLYEALCKILFNHTSARMLSVVAAVTSMWRRRFNRNDHSQDIADYCPFMLCRQHCFKTRTSNSDLKPQMAEIQMSIR